MRWTVALLALELAVAEPLPAQPVQFDRVITTDTSLRHRVQLQGGTVLLGRITEIAPDSVRILLESGQTLVLVRSAVKRVEQFPSSRVRGGVYWPPNPSSTRLLFSPNAFALGRGERYFNNVWLFFNHVVYGLSDRFSLGGGLSAFPTRPFLENNIFFVTPKLTLLDGERGAVALGALLGWVPGLDREESSGSLGILYALGSAGSRESHASLGLGWGYYGKDLARRPIAMLGGQARLSRRLAVLSENWVPPDPGDALLSLGFRVVAEALSVDLAFLNVASDPRFPGIPWVGFTVRF